jgi:periplasmic protein TonB
MLISKFDLYKAEWLDLVFDNRNKSYGAYELRQHYGSNMAKAMGITFLTISVAFGASLLFLKQPEAIKPPDERVITVIQPPVTAIKPPEVTKPEQPLRTEAAKPIKMTQNLPPVVAPDPVAKEPVKNSELTGVIGPKTADGPVGPAPIAPAVTSNDGVATAPDETIHSAGGVDVMPEPVGGAAAWAKFLQKNLRFPAVAQEEGESGRVIVSFVIEKDGSLSNIMVEKPAGHGFDEEAMRVLKLAKAWKPGKQNGLPVRVRYMIPINFQLANGD